MDKIDERLHYYVLVYFNEDGATISSLNPERFELACKTWIAGGWHNLRNELFLSAERSRSDDTRPLPDHVRVFVYWEPPEAMPTMEQIHEWALAGRALDVRPYDLPFHGLPPDEGSPWLA